MNLKIFSSDPRRRNLAVLAALALVSVLLAILALDRRAAEVAPKYPPQATFPGLAGKLGEVTRIHIESKKDGAFDVTFVPMKGWVLPGRSNYPASFEEVRKTLVGLAALQTIAPKFTGRFNKGVDYVGDLKQFEKEFNEDLAVIAFAIKKYGLPATLKLSVHSGSDKFSLYAPIRRALKKFNAGLHLKTAGTTWLEEVIGLAEAGGDGLVLAKEIYSDALEHVDELCAPYATVIDIDRKKLPTRETVNGWTSEQYVSALRHDQANKAFNSSFRQLIHVGFKIAAKKGDRYLNALKKHEAVIAKNVTQNLFERHMKPLLLGK